MLVRGTAVVLPPAQSHIIAYTVLDAKIVIGLIDPPVEVRELFTGGHRHKDSLLRLVSPVNEVSA